MARSTSGRIVIDINPEKKTRLYEALDLEGITLKDWFARTADSFTNESFAPSLIKPTRQEIFSGARHQKHSQKKYSTVSMFSGCGGMDLGFTGGFKVFNQSYEKLPYEIIWANDLNEAACQTYRRNLKHNINCGDVWKHLDSLPTTADILIGGFPCQDISINGKRAGIDGQRSGLYRAMVAGIQRCKPRLFVAENVKGLLHKSNASSLERVIHDFKELGYTVSYQLYNAADYGVPQTRERIFIVGVRGGEHRFHPPRKERDRSAWITAEEAVGDLEDASENQAINHIWSRANKSPEQGNRHLRSDRPAHTIRAECHGNIQFHYKLPRRISMREAARFQSFPDEFLFTSKLRETERQIGNAVPPVLAWHVAKCVLDCFND
jgi:DNA (cytosine-5)-methyltransferase 1